MIKMKQTVKYKFTTIKEQIDKLKEYGLIDNENDYPLAEKLLKKVKYFYLLDGCGKIFIEDSKRRSYKSGTKLANIYDCYKFDVALKEALLSSILKVEQQINTLIAHYFSKHYQGECQQNVDFYLNSNNYYTDRDFSLELTKFVSNPDNNIEFLGYIENREKAPLWVVANSLNFGLTTKLYNSLDREIQKQVCAEIGFFSTAELGEILMVLNKFRNICAHHGTPLFDGEMVNLVFKEGENFTKEARIVKWMREDNSGRYDFYALMKVLALLLDFDDWWQLEKRVNALLVNVKEAFKEIDGVYNELERVMGLTKKDGKWAKKILNGVTFQIKNVQDWYSETLLDTAFSDVDAAEKILDSRFSLLQEKIQDWMNVEHNKKYSGVEMLGDKLEEIKNRDRRKEQKESRIVKFNNKFKRN